MGRGKVAMEFITREKTRMLTFQNRKKSLFKKAHELSVLCDVDVCVIINGFLTTNQRNNQSEIWPKNSEEVRRIITKYEATNSRRKTTSTLSSFFPERQENSNKKMPFPVWDGRLDCFSAEQSFDLLEDLGQRLKMVDKRMDELQTHVDDQLPIIDSSSGEEQIMNDGCFVFASPPDEFFDDCAMNWVNQNFQNDFPLNNGKLLDFPIESMLENYIILPDPYIGMPPLDDCSAATTVPSDDCARNWVNQNFQNDFPLNNEKLLDLPIEYMPENYIILPDPYIGMPPLDDCSAAATVPSESSGLPPFPPSSTPSMPFLGRQGLTWSGFFDGDCDYQMNDKEEERFCTIGDIANFLFS